MGPPVCPAPGTRDNIEDTDISAISAAADSERSHNDIQTGTLFPMERQLLGRILTSWVLAAGCLYKVKIAVKEEVRGGYVEQGSELLHRFTQGVVRMTSVAGIKKT